MKQIAAILLLTFALIFMAGCETDTKHASNESVDEILDLIEEYFQWIDEGVILSHMTKEDALLVYNMLLVLRQDLYSLKDSLSSEARLKDVISSYVSIMEYPLGVEDRGHFEELTSILKDLIYQFQSEKHNKTFLIYEFEGFDTELGDWSQYNVIGDEQVWASASYGKPLPCAVMSGYDGQNSNQNEDWLISPAFDFSLLTSASLDFDEAINYAKAIVETINTVWISTDYEGSGDPNEANWTQLEVEGRSIGNSFDWYTVTTHDLSDYVGNSSVYIAFKYTTTDSVTDTWEIDNILVSGKQE